MRMISTLTIALVATSLAAAPAMAKMHKINVNLDSKSEVPPNDSKATGPANLTYDDATKTLTWKITTKNLTGDASAAHIHGPAEAGANSGVLVNLAPGGVINPILGSATLSDEQATAFKAGKTYINVHTAANKGGEIRGQIKP